MESDDLNLRIFIQEEYRSRSRGWFQWLFDRLPLQAGEIHLDLGCGTGMIWLMNAERLPLESRVVLSDLAPGMVNSARTSLLDLPRPYTFTCADASTLPFPPETFQTVLVNGVLDLVPDIDRSLMEIKRVLKKGGVMAAATGGFGHLEELDQLATSSLPGIQFGKGSDRFLFENGAEKVGEFFGDVRSHPFHDRLVFSEPDPLIVYAFSEISQGQSQDSENLQKFRKILEEALKSNAEIQVSIRKGLITGRK